MGVDALVLVGGYGSRLRRVLPPGWPKALADVNGEPFLKILLGLLRNKGFKRVVLCAGYNAVPITQFAARDPDLVLSFEGPKPRGTWPAVVGAARFAKSDPFVVVNGDTYCDLDYRDLMRRHDKSGLPLTVAVDEGDVPVGSFVASRVLLTLHPAPAEGTNLEDMIEKARNLGQVYRRRVSTPWFDIGTQAGLARFRDWHSRNAA